MNRFQESLIKDCNRISIDIVNKTCNTIDEVARKDINKSQHDEILLRLIESIEYKLEEIKGYAGLNKNQ